jgi:hypothetical protein
LIECPYFKTKGGEYRMKKIIALFTAMAFALTLGVAFAAEPMSSGTSTAPAKKAEKKAKKAKAKKAKKEKKEMKTAPTGTK